MKLYNYSFNTNAGDVISPRLLRFFKPNLSFETAKWNSEGKLLAIGSILECLSSGDVVWGSGFIYRKSKCDLENLKVLAIRGPLSRERLTQNNDDCYYGDPGILVSLMFARSEVKRKRGIIPHFYDYEIAKEQYPNDFIIDILQPIDTLIEQITECEEIYSSSLHGLVFAEAFNIPATWIALSENLTGGDFKFHDYMMGTGRDPQEPGLLPPISSVRDIQKGLLKSLDFLDIIKP